MYILSFVTDTFINMQKIPLCINQNTNKSFETILINMQVILAHGLAHTGIVNMLKNFPLINDAREIVSYNFY